MENFYAYIAVFTFDPDGISIEFPDLPGCLSCADSYQEAYENAEEALSLHLYSLEQTGESIPKASRIEEIQLESGQFPALIRVNMCLERAKIENVTIKKTVTLPAYMNIWGEQHHINFSGLLQDKIRSMIQEEKFSNSPQNTVCLNDSNMIASANNGKHESKSNIIMWNFSGIERMKM